MSNFILACLMLVSGALVMGAGVLGSFLDHRGSLTVLWMGLVVFGFAVVSAIPSEWVR